MKSKMTCENCRYFKADTDGNGVCYRYPPTTQLVPVQNVANQVSWQPATFRPAVRASDTCGEYVSALTLTQ